MQDCAIVLVHCSIQFALASIPEKIREKIAMQTIPAALAIKNRIAGKDIMCASTAERLQAFLSTNKAVTARRNPAGIRKRICRLRIEMLRWAIAMINFHNTFSAPARITMHTPVRKSPEGKRDESTAALPEKNKTGKASMAAIPTVNPSGTDPAFLSFDPALLLNPALSFDSPIFIHPAGHLYVPAKQSAPSAAFSCRRSTDFQRKDLVSVYSAFSSTTAGFSPSAVNVTRMSPALPLPRMAARSLPLKVFAVVSK